MYGDDFIIDPFVYPEFDNFPRRLPDTRLRCPETRKVLVFSTPNRDEYDSRIARMLRDYEKKVRMNMEMRFTAKDYDWNSERGEHSRAYIVPESHHEAHRCHLPHAVIIDLDDVLFYSRPILKMAERLYLRGDNIWKFFNELVLKAPVNLRMLNLIEALALMGANLVFVTARSEELEVKTRRALHAYLRGLPFELHMRPVGDKTRSCELKRRILCTELIPRYLIDFALDDDSENCAMYASFGIPTMQVINAEGRRALSVRQMEREWGIEHILPELTDGRIMRNG